MEYKINDCNYDIKCFIKENICKEFNIDYWNEWLENQDYKLLQKSPNYFVSVEDDNSLIGICAVKKINQDECNLNTFYIRKEYRNKGIGKKLFNMCMEYIKENKYKKITLCVDPKFEIAKVFYEKNGFKFDYYDEDRYELNYYKEL